MKIFIIAGNYRQAVDWALENGLRKQDWEYLSSADRLRGRTNPVLVWTGSWRERPDAQEFVMNARFCQRTPA